MAGFKMFALSYWLADRTSEVISSLGALVAPLGISHVWQARQSASRTALSIAASHVAWNASTVKQHMGLTLNANAEIDAPSGTLVADTPYVLFVHCDGSSELTWASIFNWGTDGAYDFSAETAGKIVAVYMFAYSATRIHCSAKGGFADSP